MNRVILILVLIFPVLSHSADAHSVKTIQRNIEMLDEKSEGDLGLFVRRLGDNAELNIDGDRVWYLASTIKIPVAIAVLKNVEAGKLKLSDEVILKESDFVDGSGETNWKESGTTLTISYLLEKMLTQSDSTATDILIRKIGVDELNRAIKQAVPEGFNQLTSILQVRYDAYRELHLNARELSNMDFIVMKTKKSEDEKLKFLIDRMKVEEKDLKAKSIDEAFERYYQRNLNSATLRAFANLLEKLSSRQLLSKKNTEYVLSTMEKMTTGEKRLKAGLPKEIKFAQKTGTQRRRICNMGITRSNSKPIAIIAACVEKFDDQDRAEKLLAKVGAHLAPLIK